MTDDDPVWDEDEFANRGRNKIAIFLTGGMVEFIHINDREMEGIHQQFIDGDVLVFDDYNGWINTAHVVLIKCIEDDE